MEMSKRKIGIIVVILTSVFIGNIIFYYSKKIEGPVFTYVYKEGSDFELTYLMDQDEKDKIETFIFPDIDDTEYIEEDMSMPFMFMSSEDSNKDTRFDDGSARYNIYKIRLYNLRNKDGLLEGKGLSDKLRENTGKSITKIKYRTKNGKEGECEIGNLIYSENRPGYTERPYNLYEFESVTTKKDYYEALYTAEDDIELVRLDGIHKEGLLKYFEIFINGENIEEVNFPVKLKSKDKFSISIKPKVKIPFYESYESKLSVIARDPEDSEQEVEVFGQEGFGPGGFSGYKNYKVTYKEVEDLLELRRINNEK
ncbi:hypothetical protein [Clostridium sp. LP20]|uniref:hypothetical protein n=1 Tax=Clostridium sp. LP20 TaxID=3418665 RepID=UPI003EE6BC11